MRRLATMLIALVMGAASVAAEPLYDKPVYHDPSEGYFELVSLLNQYPGQFTRNSTSWREVKQLAEDRFHNGRRGRLAVVHSREINDFLRDVFQPDRMAWFGLRYYCKYNAAMWVTGKRLAPGAYQNWARVWNNATTNPTISNPPRNKCTRQFKYLPVHYWPVEYGFRWNAHGGGKHQRYFFVEYPRPDKYRE